VKTAWNAATSAKSPSPAGTNASHGTNALVESSK
jgi:hypothetical protein